MDHSNILIWSFVASTAMTTIEATSQWLGLSRLSIPIVLGSITVDDRDRAAAVGFVLHLVVGVALGFGYGVIFESLGAASWWIGGLMGIAHALIVLGVIFPLLPGIHPRMASEIEGPTAKRQLEPPGFMGLHYGTHTSLVILVTHAIYGIILGLTYVVQG